MAPTVPQIGFRKSTLHPSNICVIFNKLVIESGNSSPDMEVRGRHAYSKKLTSRRNNQRS